MIVKNNKVIIKNVLSIKDYQQLKEVYESYDMPWLYNDGVSYIGDGEFQFVHPIWENGIKPGPEWSTIIPILNVLSPFNIIKIKSNLRTKSPMLVESGLHRDVFLPGSFTAIYYVNTCNGYTKWEDGDKIESQANMLVVFPSNMRHLGTSCTDVNRRTVINFNYMPPVDHLDSDNNLIKTTNEIAMALYSEEDIAYHTRWGNIA